MKSRKILTLSLSLFGLFGLVGCNPATSSSSVASETTGNNSSENNTGTEVTKKDLVQAYVDYFFSRQGLSVISENGGMLPAGVLQKASSFDASKYTVLQQDASKVTFSVAGSTSVQKITDAMASNFKKLFTKGAPSFDTTNQTGSGTAVAGLKAGTAYVGFLSKEVAGSDQTDLDALKGSKTHFAIDAVVPIVHTGNQLTNITLEQLDLIYGGAYYYEAGQALEGKTALTSWSNVEGSGLTADIKPYTRDQASGTRECFTEKIGLKDAKKDEVDGKKTLSEKVTEVDSNGSMISSVGKDAGAIGYASFDSVKSDTKVKMLGVEGVTPSEETILDKTFVLQRNFNLVVGEGIELPAITADFNK